MKYYDPAEHNKTQALKQDQVANAPTLAAQKENISSFLEKQVFKKKNEVVEARV